MPMGVFGAPNDIGDPPEFHFRVIGFSGPEFQVRPHAPNTGC